MFTPNENERFTHTHDIHLSFTEWTPGSVSRWIGKCRFCKKAVSTEVRQDVKLTWQWSQPDKLYFSKRMYEYVPLSPYSRYITAKNGHYVTVTCPNGCLGEASRPEWREISLITCKRINGKHNDSIKCNGKCINATGPNCECSCAGENHGAQHLT